MSGRAIEVLQGTHQSPFHATDDPRTTNSPPAYGNGIVIALVLNPDYLIQQAKISEERVRYNVAKNQLLPELDLKAAYGFNGLGASPTDAWTVADSGNFPSWSVGVQLTVPLGANVAAGRHVFTLRAVSGGQLDQSDAFFVVDVER